MLPWQAPEFFVSTDPLALRRANRTLQPRNRTLRRVGLERLCGGRL